MSRGFEKEGDKEEVPLVPPRAYLPSGVVNYVTENGLRELKDELQALIVERDAVVGNTETDRRVARNFIAAKIALLDERIQSAQVVDSATQQGDVVAFGASVTLRYDSSSSLVNYQITGVDEADIRKGKISFISPVAVAIMGMTVGEKRKIRLPNGERTVEVVQMSYTNS